MRVGFHRLASRSFQYLNLHTAFRAKWPVLKEQLAAFETPNAVVYIYAANGSGLYQVRLHTKQGG